MKYIWIMIIVLIVLVICIYLIGTWGTKEVLSEKINDINFNELLMVHIEENIKWVDGQVKLK